MVKKWLTVLFICVYFAAPGVIHAQASSSATLGIPIMGQDCGSYLNAPPNNKCCYMKIDWTITPVQPNVGLAGVVIGAIMNFVTHDIIGGIFGPTIGTLEQTYSNQMQPCVEGQPSTPGHPEDPNCICIQKVETQLEAMKPLCASISSASEKTSCLSCLSQYPVGIWTGMGCIRANVQSFIQDTLLNWGIGLAGGVSMLCIIYSAFMMQTSGGNAEKVKKAQQLLTACITGLMLIIFSVLILRIIGVSILRIPGLS